MLSNKKNRRDDKTSLRLINIKMILTHCCSTNQCDQQNNGVNRYHDNGNDSEKAKHGFQVLKRSG